MKHCELEGKEQYLLENIKSTNDKDGSCVKNNEMGTYQYYRVSN